MVLYGFLMEADIFNRITHCDSYAIYLYMWLIFSVKLCVTFGVYIGLAGLLMVILLWVLFTKCHLK